MIQTYVNCPNCGVGKTGATVRSVVPASNSYVSVAATCNVCCVMFVLSYDSTGAGMPSLRQENIARLNAATGIPPNWKRTSALPERPSARVVEHLSQPVADSLAEAEANFGDKRLVSAAMMYRRSMELAIKELYPDITGSLWHRIQALRDQKAIPSGLTEIMDGARVLGNDATHEGETPSKADIGALRDFTSLLLTYLVELPEKARLARSRREAATSD